VLDVVFPLVCPGCGDRGAPLCPRCSGQLAPPVPAPPPAGVDAWCAPFAYEGAGRELVARVKYRNVRAVVPWLASAMATAVADAGLVSATAVTWAPTTPARRRARGFDPAELLARAVARRLGVRCPGLLDRLPGPPQTGLAAAARRRGPGFVSRRGAPACVLVVDDIATTGATLTAAASTLRAAGAREVVAVTAARTPPPW
jgi:predicted amidophosphoribosyltransferase